jgi:hypothetical protein
MYRNVHTACVEIYVHQSPVFLLLVGWRFGFVRILWVHSGLCVPWKGMAFGDTRGEIARIDGGWVLHTVYVEVCVQGETGVKAEVVPVRKYSENMQSPKETYVVPISKCTLAFLLTALRPKCDCK